MTPDELYTDVYSRLVTGHSMLRDFREVTGAGFLTSKSVIYARSRKVVQYLTSRLDWPNFLKDAAEYERLGGVEWMVERLSAQAMQSAVVSVDAASLIFAHSILDAAVSDLLRITSMLAPQDWEHHVRDKKPWTVAEVKQSDYTKLLRGLLFEEMERIERNTSLPKKAQILGTLCRPEPEWELPTFEQSELERVDELRHQLVHGRLLGRPIDTIRGDLKVLDEAGWYFFVIVQKRYSPKLVLFG